MKKNLLSLIILSGFSVSAQNISENSLGLRLGSSNGLGTELSFQRKLSKTNRLEIDLGWRTSRNISATKLTGLYHWVWNLDGDFNWYAGIGGGFGSYRNSNTINNGSGTFFYAAGDIGIEYNFDFPLQLSMDIRPELGGVGYYDDNYGSDIALGARYKF